MLDNQKLREMIRYISQNVTNYCFIIRDVGKDIVNESGRVFRYPRWVSDIWKKLLREEEINIICSWCVRIIVQKIDIKISKDKNLFI